MNGPVQSLVVHNGEVFAGGAFTEIGGVIARRIAKWNGSSWVEIGGGVSGSIYTTTGSGSVETIAFDSEGKMHIGGTFRQMGSGVTVRNGNSYGIWDGANWVAGTPVTSSENQVPFHEIEFFNGVVFARISGIGEAGGTVRGLFNGNWIPPGSSSPSSPTRMLVRSDGLYVLGGRFLSGNGADLRYIFRWNGTSWSGLGTGLNDVADSMFSYDGKLYVAGSKLQSAGGVAVQGVASWNGSAWSSVPFQAPELQDFAFRIYDLLVDSNQVLFTGAFNYVGCRTSNGFGRAFLNSFTGSSNNDWHSSGNWHQGGVPNSSVDASISTSDVQISSADAVIRDLQIDEGRTLTIAAGRKLTITRNLTVLGSIVGEGVVEVSNCDPNSLSRMGDGSIQVTLTRCVDSNESFVFPVGTQGGMSELTLSKIAGNGSVSVKAVETPIASGELPSNRLQRYWITSKSNAVVSADMTFNYRQQDILSGNEDEFGLFAINGSNVSS